MATGGLSDDEQNTDTEDDETTDSGIVADISPYGREVFHDTDGTSKPQDSSTSRVDFSDLSRSRTAEQGFNTTDIITASLEGDALTPSTTTQNLPPF